MRNSANQLLAHFAQNATPEALAAKLNAMAAAMGDTTFCRRVAEEIVNHTQPQQAVPEVYAHYRPFVRDGIRFFLSQVGRPRLVALIVAQRRLNPEADAKERLLELAKRFPTLHKLGQTIARNPAIDPLVKRWLIHLENGRYGTPLAEIQATIATQLEVHAPTASVQVEATLLSEASVGAVVPFHWNPPASQTAPVNGRSGVFKVLKPGIQEQIAEELVILEKTARFFETHRDDYPLGDLKFNDIFQEVRQRLVKEIDLISEQAFLTEAANVYRDMPAIQIPAVSPLSTAGMTAMTYIDGAKITDATLTSVERRWCARRLFEALICKPLFHRSEQSLFHGDPHAGNILAVRNSATGEVQIALLDWSLAGRLDKGQRVRCAQLIQALIKQDLTGIRRAVSALACDDTLETAAQRQRFRQRALTLLRTADFAQRPLIARLFRLLEHLSLEGFVFPADLMLFGKAVFALEGVLMDLWPDFDMDAAFRQHLATLITHEIPRRIGGLLNPMADRPEQYASLISNAELHALIAHQYLAAVWSHSSSIGAYLDAWGRLFTPQPPRAPLKIPVMDRRHR
ncbi:MAG: AarF/UbiB family protein [Desulfosarcinaceae bacterium]|nr:AarF/UbiB family protein [Desulfosarcinaceae bacterium]